MCDPFQIRQTLHKLNLAYTHVSISGVTVCSTALISSKSVLTDCTPLSSTEHLFCYTIENGGRRGISLRAQDFWDKTAVLGNPIKWTPCNFYVTPSLYTKECRIVWCIRSRDQFSPSHPAFSVLVLRFSMLQRTLRSDISSASEGNTSPAHLYKYLQYSLPGSKGRPFKYALRWAAKSMWQ